MAKKTEIKKDNKEQNTAATIITGLLFCGFGLFLAVSIFTYLFTWKNATSESLNTGTVGVEIAKAIVWKFGVGALPVSAVIFFVGFHILRRSRKFGRYLFILLSATVMLSFVPAYLLHGLEPAYRTWFGAGAGGSLGYSFVSSLLKAIGEVGSLLFFIILITAYGLYITPKTAILLKYLWQKSVALLKLPFSKSKRQPPSASEAQTPTVETSSTQSAEQNAETDIFGDARYADEPDDEEEDEDETDDEPRTPKPRIPEYNRRLEIESKVIEEKYLPEEMLTGELYDPTKDLSGYKRPPVDLLKDYPVLGDSIDSAELNRNKDKIVEILGQFKIKVDKISATVGPTVTLYEIIPQEGIRIAQIKRLEDDIALRIAAIGVRIIAPMPGKGTVGIEVPNEKPDIVSMRSIIKSAKFQESKFDLPVVLGKTILGEVFAFDLAKMPHLLVAGATGQGKSVGLNAILTSLLYKKHPAELKIVMVDPKKVELTPYNKIERHFLAKLPDTEEPIITDTQKVIYTLKSLCMEMDNRYDLLKMAGVRNVKEYNDKFVSRNLNPLKGHRYLPYVLLVIDEFADLIMTAGREIEEPIARLAQLARAIGIHLVIATQRPTTNIITGLIKANFPARIAFRVTSMIDSRTILDTPGANQLIGRGDMLVSTGAELIRVQCALVETPEIDRLTDFISTQPGYAAAYDLPEYVDEKSAEKQVDMKNLDEMFEDAARLIVQNQMGSTSLIQRKMSLGYNRSGRIMDQLQAAGIVGPAEGSKPRQVLITDLQSLEKILAAFRKGDN
ncbi:MAG: DNA translocase FtsK [Prevotellaceae bacterium]|jgi:S-DNA-T family DNA segregation ATPase FtsK/SpoIIIE|nr:DNA translocase FtsK [Prevotellaceae bacterium]